MKTKELTTYLREWARERYPFLSETSRTAIFEVCARLEEAERENLELRAYPYEWLVTVPPRPDVDHDAKWVGFKVVSRTGVSV